MHRAHAHAEAQILGVAKGALDPPAFGVEVDHGPGGLSSGADGQAPRLLHALGLHAHHCAHFVTRRSDRGAAEHARTPAGADPIGRCTGLAIGGGDHDIAPETDHEVELQLLRQHPVELLVAKAAIRHDAHAHLGGQRLGQAHQDLILVVVAPGLQRGGLDRQPHQRRRPAMAA